MRRILLSGGLAMVSATALLIYGCGGGGYGGGSGVYGGGGGTGGGGGAGGIVTSITISPGNAGISSGGSQQFTAVAKDSSGNTVASPMLSWKSSNTAVATVDQSGLANAVGVGTAGITASSTYLGTVYTSNTATLTVTLADAVMGTAAVGHALSGALVTLRDADGRSESSMSDRDGRFQISTAGLKAPFLLKAEDGRGHALFGAAAKDGVANIDTATDLMLRSWYGAHGTDPETAFATRAVSPDAKSLKALDEGFGKMLRGNLTEQGLDADHFSLLSTPFNADGTGFDRLLDGMSVSPGRTGLHVSTSGREMDVGFGRGTVIFSTGVADGQAMSNDSLELP